MKGFNQYNYHMEKPAEPLREYRDGEQITSIAQLPIPHSHRICTDTFCTIISSLFALIMLIMAIVNFNLSSLQKMTYPTDQMQRSCTLDNSNYNYLYFTSMTDPSKRLCVAKCPAGTEAKLDCWPTSSLSCSKNSNPAFQVNIYPTVASETQLGLFCMPADQTIKNTILANAGLLQKFQFVSAYKAIGFSALIAIGFGFLFLISVYCAPAATAYASIALGGLGCIAVAILILISQSNLLKVYQIITIIFCVVMILVGLFILWSLFKHTKDINLCIKYLETAGTFFSQFPGLVLLIFVFYALMIGLVALIGFQTLAFWSAGSMVFHPNEVYYEPTGLFSTFMTILSFIQFVWGMCFLKQSFNFLIAGTTVRRYFNEVHSLKFGLGNLFKFHWGSVVGGSFFLYFLYIYDVFYDALMPSPTSGCFNFYVKMCCCCDRVAGLSRSQTMAYINMVGVPYCNASRRCEDIDLRSSYFDGSQSINRYFRIGAHVLLAILSTVFAYIYMNSNGTSISILALLFSFILNIFVITYFICLIADMADGVLLCFLVQKFLNGEDQILITEDNQPPKGIHNGKEGYQIHPYN